MRPSTLEGMRLVYGIGDNKLRDFGGRFFQVLDAGCRRLGLTRDQSADRVEPRKPVSRSNPVRTLAFDLFRQGAVVEDVMHQTNRGRSTVIDYLAEYIREERPPSIAAWVKDEIYQRVAAAARRVGTDRLKPIFLALGEQVAYDDIRLVVAHLLATDTSSEK